MEKFKLETAGILDSFMKGDIGFPQYITATDAAFAGAMPRLGNLDIPQLRAVMLGNHNTVMEEMLRRGPSEPSEAENPVGPVLPLKQALRGEN